MFKKQKNFFLGIIIDVSYKKPKKIFSNSENSIQLKIINNDFEKFLIKEKNEYIKVSIFIEDYIVFNVGDIIFLNNYKFEANILNPNKIKAKPLNGNIYIVFRLDSKNNELLETDILISSLKTKESFKFSEKFKKKLIKISNKKDIFFSNNSIINLAFWKGFVNEIPTANKNFNFDIILKLNSIIKDEKCCYYKFNDYKNNIFAINNFNNVYLEIGNIYKIGSIAKIDINLNLICSSKTSIMLVPLYFYDHKYFSHLNYVFINNNKNEGKINLKINGSKNKKNMNTNKNIIDKLTALINKKFINKEISSLEYLINLSENFNYDNEANSFIQENYRIRCYVIDIYPKDIFQSIKKICLICNKYYELDIDAQYCCLKELKFCIKLKMFMKDDSIDNSSKIFNSYLFAFDINNLFPEINFDLSINNISSNKNKLNKIFNSILECENMDFIVESFINEKFINFKIVETIFSYKIT